MENLWIWLVVEPYPCEKYMTSSIGMIIMIILNGKIKHVPNIEPIKLSKSPNVSTGAFMYALQLGYSSNPRTLSEFSWRVAANNRW